jgi:hypothetical protein
MQKKILTKIYKKYGYRIFDCSVDDFKKYYSDCYLIKKIPVPKEKFTYYCFSNVEEAIKKINCVFIPMEHGELPKIKWSLNESNQLLIKEIYFYNYEDQSLYQQSVERAWALGGHLDIRAEQCYYD